MKTGWKFNNLNCTYYLAGMIIKCVRFAEDGTVNYVSDKGIAKSVGRSGADIIRWEIDIS